ncbi:MULTISPECIES: ArsR/SmtB family transcription factor [Bacillus amyloliquefaciens group]|uniref:ArsR/SmtB family transcription factor n=1 Tax=Bacillus amyloliquefaciens group TaxID=1938374 RepID=UPI001C9DF6DF|nr:MULTISPECIES: metalloregulator ArsR/SmtB family transcription factor [Bacillus amyloliquefaciens group]MDX7982815.1 metalloregulator ArsR/SmtB family transcription factor [Bacillus velezensis]QZT39701.1 metalloregulator ArsR/SmtB family transcription factor [Bacillus amyloliquefaciens]WHY37349.1 metalloregulator ArsR/SmtB family transcription factor [Bacillus velezensis]
MENNSKLQQAVKIYKALGEPTRLKITRLLVSETNLCCSDIGIRLESIAGSTLSHHLKQLTDCGLLSTHKEGTYVYYLLDRELIRKYAPYVMT